MDLGDETVDGDHAVAVFLGSWSPGTETGITFNGNRWWNSGEWSHGSSLLGSGSPGEKAAHIFNRLKQEGKGMICCCNFHHVKLCKAKLLLYEKAVGKYAMFRSLCSSRKMLLKLCLILVAFLPSQIVQNTLAAKLSLLDVKLCAVFLAMPLLSLFVM